MTEILVHSLNLRSNFKSSADFIKERINNEESECTAILLQDIGNMGPDGSPLIKRAVQNHHLFINFSLQNKSRSVALIVHKNWEIRKVLRNQEGSLVGACIERGGYKLLIMSAYLPTSLDNYGAPLDWDPNDESQKAKAQVKHMR